MKSETLDGENAIKIEFEAEVEKKTIKMARTYKPQFGHICWLISGFMLHLITSYGYFIFLPHFLLFWGLYITELDQ